MYFGILLLAVRRGERRIAVRRASHRRRRRVRSTPDVATVGRDARGDRCASACAPRCPRRRAPGATRSPKGLRGKAEGVFPALGSGLRGGERGGVRSIDLPTRSPARGAASTRSARSRCELVRPVRTRAPHRRLRRAHAGHRRTGGRRPATAHRLRRRDGRHAAHHDEPARPGRRQPRRAAVRLRRLDAPHPLARDRAPRRAHGAAGGAGVDARGERRARPRRCCDGRPRRCTRRAPTPGFEAGVSACVSAVARLVHDGYAVEVLDSDGTVLAERIDGGDMTEVEAMLVALRDDHRAPRRQPHPALASVRRRVDRDRSSSSSAGSIRPTRRR